jgi:hypothetical protein
MARMIPKIMSSRAALIKPGLFFGEALMVADCDMGNSFPEEDYSSFPKC